MDEWMTRWGDGWAASEEGIRFVWEAGAHYWQREQCV